MNKVEWNKEHSWKVTKKLYKDGIEHYLSWNNLIWSEHGNGKFNMSDF